MRQTHLFFLLTNTQQTVDKKPFTEKAIQEIAKNTNSVVEFLNEISKFRMSPSVKHNSIETLYHRASVKFGKGDMSSTIEKYWKHYHYDIDKIDVASLRAKAISIKLLEISEFYAVHKNIKQMANEILMGHKTYGSYVNAMETELHRAHNEIMKNKITMEVNQMVQSIIDERYKN